MNRYGIIVEPTKTGFSAHVPDLPGCVAAGRTRAETRRLIRGALRMHLDAMRRDARSPPTSATLKTSICHPATTSHGRLTEAQRQAAGIGQGLVRLAIGLEDVDDLKADLVRGLAAL